MRRSVPSLLRGLAAAVALLALVAGVPTILAVTIGNPLDGLPDLLAGDISDMVLVDVLAAVAYAAWAQFALAVVLELLATLGRVTIPPRVPGIFAGQQRIAHSLVAALFLIGPTTTPLTTAAATAPPVSVPVATAAAFTLSLTSTGHGDTGVSGARPDKTPRPTRPPT